jgi:hypothetical protein
VVDAGVVDEDVGSFPIVRRVHGLADRPQVGDAAGYEARALGASQRRDQLGAWLGTPSDAHHARPFRDEPVCDRGPDSGARAGHDRHLALQPLHVRHAV